jgi:hypothetical protein
MARDWDQLFSNWVAGFSDTTEAKADNALRMIREAVSASAQLASKNVVVYPTGSYHHNTNTKLESDVDVAVVLKDCWYSAYPPSGQPQAEALGYGTAAYGLAAFRDDVGAALVKKFGQKGVTPGQKAFDVHENSYRIDADVAVFVQHRRFTGEKNTDGTWHYHEGVEMRARNKPAQSIINWHDQHHTNGIAKNVRTSKRFKRITRILKRLRDDMKEGGKAAAKASAAGTASFLLESMAYNIPDSVYAEAENYKLMKAVVAAAWRATKTDEDKKTLVEVSGLKWLFDPGQAWTRAGAHEFFQHAWNHVGFSS